MISLPNGQGVELGTIRDPPKGPPFAWRASRGLLLRAPGRRMHVSGPPRRPWVPLGTVRNSFGGQHGLVKIHAEFPFQMVWGSNLGRSGALLEASPSIWRASLGLPFECARVPDARLVASLAALGLSGDCPKLVWRILEGKMRSLKSLQNFPSKWSGGRAWGAPGAIRGPPKGSSV